MDASKVLFDKVYTPQPKKIKLYHASNAIKRVKDIYFPGPRGTCDFGRGFYLTDNYKIAEEWICYDNTPIINIYDYEKDDDEILYLENEEYIRVVVGCRSQRYKINFKSNIIHGIIANDRIDRAMPSFLDGTIGDKCLLELLSLGFLGVQYMFRQHTGTLKYIDSYQLQSFSLSDAINRKNYKRNVVNDQYRKVLRKDFKNQKYVEDYLHMGDYDEV